MEELLEHVLDGEKGPRNELQVWETRCVLLQWCVLSLSMRISWIAAKRVMV